MKMGAGIMAGMVNYTISMAFLETGHFVCLLQAYDCMVPGETKEGCRQLSAVYSCVHLDVQDMTTLQPSL